MNDNYSESIKQQIYSSGLCRFNLETTENEKSRKEAIEENSIKKEMTLFKEGYNLILGYIDKNSTDGFFVSGEAAEKVAIEDCKISGDVLRELENVENWRTWLSREEKLQGVVKFSNQVLYNFYEIAIHYHETNNTESSNKCFAFLCHVNPKVASFWLGMGLTSEKLQNYDKAISEFETAIKMNHTDFTPYLGIIRCSQELNDYSVIENVLNENKDNEDLKDNIRDAFEYIAVVKQK